jgi:HPt (histidine-containing phosphotransfer) domain-containing protein
MSGAEARGRRRADETGRRGVGAGVLRTQLGSAMPGAPVDLSELWRLGDSIGGREPSAFVEQLVGLFLRLAPSSYALAERSFRCQDADSLARSVHKLRGRAAYFGATRLVSVCRELELRALANAWRDCPRLLEDLEDELDRVTAALRRLRRPDFR